MAFLTIANLILSLTTLAIAIPYAVVALIELKKQKKEEENG